MESPFNFAISSSGETGTFIWVPPLEVIAPYTALVLLTPEQHRKGAADLAGLIFEGTHIVLEQQLEHLCDALTLPPDVALKLLDAMMEQHEKFTRLAQEIMERHNKANGAGSN